MYRGTRVRPWEWTETGPRHPSVVSTPSSFSLPTSRNGTTTPTSVTSPSSSPPPRLSRTTAGTGVRSTTATGRPCRRRPTCGPRGVRGACPDQDYGSCRSLGPLGSSTSTTPRPSFTSLLLRIRKREHPSFFPITCEQSSFYFIRQNSYDQNFRVISYNL